MSGFPLRTLATTLTARTAPALDTIAKTLHSVSTSIFGAQGPVEVRNALYGTWLGHPLHPAVTDLPLGFWSASALLDLAGNHRGADLALKAGTLGALASALTGIAQWYDLQEEDEPRRLGTLHATMNVGATALYGLSWLQRDAGMRDAGKITAFLGLGLTTLAAQLGGDLSFQLGIGVNRVAFTSPNRKWKAVVALDALQDGHLTRADHGDDPLVLLRDGDRVLATSATCTHVGGPLDEGTINGSCVTCPWHGSVFDLTDGHVVRGPATTPLNAYETRVVDGMVQVREVRTEK